jgi:hypothetical protein
MAGEGTPDGVVDMERERHAMRGEHGGKEIGVLDMAVSYDEEEMRETDLCRLACVSIFI